MISRAEVKATTQPHIPSGRRKCNSESHKSQFRNPQIILSFPLRRAGVKVRSWWHFPAGSIRIRHRPKQEPTNLGLNTDPHPSTSSLSLFSSSSSFGFPSFPPQFQSLTHMFTPQTWHNLGLRSPGLLHTSLNEPPLNDAVFALLVNLYWL